MFNRDSILSFLDRAFQSIEMPCFGNINIDYRIARIVNVLVTSDPSLWLPVEAPNTHWSHWFPK